MNNLCSNFEFKPKFIPTIGTIIVLPLLISLGFWQLHRAEYKEALEAEIRAHAQQPPIDIRLAIQSPKDHQFHPIKFSGTFDNQHQLLLENRFHHHQLGYEIITPILLDDHNILLVNRGWVPRERAKNIEPVSKKLTLHGTVILPKSKVFSLGVTDYNESSWPRNIPNLSWASIKAALPNQNILPFIVQLAPTAEHGFVREWKPNSLSPKKNFGYAIQWFAMAGTLVIIFIALNTRRRQKDG